ncbi:hypothetical protein [Mucilaginibacter ginkgonis]|uniref:Uncharacterized protein n=1 Tax=Mucilaginibacter ginkgonis TaxID=2682091 RepID=A0A6I4HY96_9SPHI|nr:hypothetical protein [Mucilaginibacter ginkgonis]QQL50422.1 hypothetical protein GO620_002905 [Mucilaginibacter ginkgonis]
MAEKKILLWQIYIKSSAPHEIAVTGWQFELNLNSYKFEYGHLGREVRIDKVDS